MIASSCALSQQLKMKQTFSVFTLGDKLIDMDVWPNGIVYNLSLVNERDVWQTYTATADDSTRKIKLAFTRVGMDSGYKSR